MFVIANKEKDLFINEQIRAKEVMVIGPNGEQLGIKSIKDAITLSTYAGFDEYILESATTQADVPSPIPSPVSKRKSDREKRGVHQETW